MNFQSKIIIFILIALFSIVSFGSSAFATNDITSQLKIEPKSIKSSGVNGLLIFLARALKKGTGRLFVLKTYR